MQSNCVKIREEAYCTETGHVQAYWCCQMLQLMFKNNCQQTKEKKYGLTNVVGLQKAGIITIFRTIGAKCHPIGALPQGKRRFAPG